MKFTVTGFEGVDKALTELKKSTAKNVARRVLTNALKPVEEMAKRLAPVDEGDLRDSITTGTKLAGAAKKEARRTRAADGVTVYTGTSNRNGVAREFGSIRSAPQPFMRPAWEANKLRVLNDIQQNMGGEIMKAAQRAGRKNRSGK